MNIDVLIYTLGAALMMCIYVGFLVWGIKTKQFEENEHLKRKPLEEEDEEE